MKKLVLGFVIVAICFTSGCWSRREVEQLAIVGAIGFDKITLEGRDRYRVAVQVFNPASLAGTAGGGKQGGGQGTAVPNWIVTGIGDNFFDAYRNAFTRSSRYLFSAHADFFVVGERLAREGEIGKVLDIILRHKDMRLRSFLFVTPGEALTLLKAQPELESTLPRDITGMQEVAAPSVAKTAIIDVRQFATSFLSPGRDPVLGRLELVPLPTELPAPLSEDQLKRSVRLRGAAIFCRDRLVGWLDDYETRGLLILTNEIRAGVVPITMPGEKEPELSFQKIRAVTTVTPVMKDQKLSMEIKVELKGSIGTVENPIPVGKPETLATVQKRVAKTVTSHINSAIKKAQTLQTDIFGFGEAVSRTYPREWKRMEKDWRKHFARLPVTTEVDVLITGIGMISDPLQVH